MSEEYVYIVRVYIVFSKAALQKKGSMEPPLDLPLEGKEGVTSLFCETGTISKCTKNRTVEAFQSLLCWCMIPSAVAFSQYSTLTYFVKLYGLAYHRKLYS